MVAIAVGSLAFVPWLPSFAYQAAHTGTPWAKPMRPSTILTVTANDLGGIGSEGQIVGFVLTLLLLLALFGAAHDRRHIDLDLHTVPQVRMEVAVTGLTLAFGLAAIFVTAGTYESRYAAVFVPFVLVAAAVGVTRFLADWLRLAVVGVLVLGGLLGGYRNVTVERTRLGAEIVPAINANAKPGDIVLYCPDQLGPSGTRHLRSDVVTLAYPTLGPTDRVDWADYADRNAAADPDAIAQEVLARAGTHTIWYVWAGTYRTFEGQCEEVNSRVAASSSAGCGASDRRRQQVLRARLAVRVPAAHPVTLTTARRRIGEDVRAALPAWIARAGARRGGLRDRAAVARSCPSRRPHDPAPPGALRVDGAFYRDIATKGYDALPDAALRFFPLYPLSGRGLGFLLGGNEGLALLVIANVGALAAAR